MYDLVDRHLRRLDQELHKFKMELEADHAGITELLERRSLELDVTANESQKENRYSAHSGVSRHSHGERGDSLVNPAILTLLCDEPCYDSLNPAMTDRWLMEERAEQCVIMSVFR